VKTFKEKWLDCNSKDECPITIFDSIIFELEMTNLSDTVSRFKLTKIYREKFSFVK
jgi:hypothetical protein